MTVWAGANRKKSPAEYRCGQYMMTNNFFFFRGNFLSYSVCLGTVFMTLSDFDLYYYLIYKFGSNG